MQVGVVPVHEHTREVWGTHKRAPKYPPPPLISVKVTAETFITTRPNLEEIMQAQHHEAIIGVLLPTLGAPEPRVQVHAAAAWIISDREGLTRDAFVPYFNSRVLAFLALLGLQVVRDG